MYLMKTDPSYPNFSGSPPAGMIPETLPNVVNSSIVGLQDPSFLNLIISKSPKVCCLQQNREENIQP